MCFYLVTSSSNVEIFRKSSSVVTPKKSIGCYFHTSAVSNTAAVTGDTASPAKLQYELIISSKCGEFERALKILSTLRDLKHPIHSNIYCALLNHATKHHKEDVFNTVLDHISEYDIPYDVQLYTVKVVGNLKLHGFEKAMRIFDEMVTKGFTARIELLNLLFQDCLERNDTKNCIFFYDRYLQQSVLPPVHLLVKFITVCWNEGLHHCVMKLLQFYAMQNIPLDENLVHHLKWYFDNGYDER